MLYVAIAAYILNICDMFFTMHLVNEYGLEIEANPIGKWLLKSKFLTVVVKVFAMGAAFLLLYLYSAEAIIRIILYAMLGIYIILTIYHIIIVAYLKKHEL